MLAAIVLAAGASSRMGSPKAVLSSPDGHPFVARIVRSLRSAGLEAIVVVTGAAHEAVAAAIAADGVDPPLLVRNPDPSRGQLSSLWAGMDAVVREGTEGLLVTLVDVPMVQPSTISSVIAAWRTTKAPIVRPAIGDRHGHPVIFDRAVFHALREASPETGAKSVVRDREAQIVNVRVRDEGCLVDVDTRQDYEALLRVGSQTLPAGAPRGSSAD